MQIARKLSLAAFCLMMAFSWSADSAFADPKYKSERWNNDSWEREKEWRKMDNEHARETRKDREEYWREKHKAEKEAHRERFKEEREARKEHYKEHREARREFYDDCDFYPPGLRKQGKVPHGLAKQGKAPPGWAKNCRRGRGGDHRHPRLIHAHDRRNQDHGYHVPEHQRKHSPCKAVSGKARDIIVGTVMGAGIGGIIGSGTGDTEAGAILGGVAGGIIGAAAGDGDKDPC